MATHCPMCTEKVPFVDVNELEVHLATQHFHVSPYGCALCGMESKWATEYALKGHYARAHGINDVKIKFQLTEVEVKAQSRIEEVIARALLPLPTTVGNNPHVVYEGPETVDVEHHTRTWAEIKAEEREREKENAATKRKGSSARSGGKQAGGSSSSMTTRRQRAVQPSTSTQRQRVPRERVKSAKDGQRSGTVSKGPAWRTLNMNLAALSKKAPAQSEFSLGDI